MNKTLKIMKHKNLGIVYITKKCIELQKNNPDPTSTFVKYNNQITEVTTALLQEII